MSLLQALMPAESSFVSAALDRARPSMRAISHDDIPHGSIPLTRQKRNSIARERQRVRRELILKTISDSHKPLSFREIADLAHLHDHRRAAQTDLEYLVDTGKIARVDGFNPHYGNRPFLQYHRL